MIRSKCNFLSLLSVLLLQFPILLSAQQNERYQGEFEVGRYTGKADFRYLISGTDTIFDGPFQMQRSSLEALLEKEDSSFLFNGAFENGTAEGPWKFEFADYQSNSQSKVIDFEYRVLISGVQEEAKGAFKNGRLDGDWSYLVNRVKDSEIDTVLFKSEFSFENGVPQRNFKIANDSTVLIGRFLRNGLAHDEWSSFSFAEIEDRESWYFEEGLLKRIEVVRDEVEETFPVFDGQAADSRIITLNKSYLTLVKAVVRTKGNSFESKNGITRLLAQNDSYYQKIDTILRQLGSSGFEAKYKVKVPFYKLDSIEKKSLEAISDDYEQANKISARFLQNTHLNIIKRSDENALYNYRVAEKISKEFLGPISILATYKDAEILEYVPLKQVLPLLWPDGKPTKEIVVVEGLSEQMTFLLDNAQDFNFEGTALNSVQQMAAYARASLERIENDMSDRLTNEERLQELNGLEEDLIALNNVLIQKVDSLEKMPAKYRRALTPIKSLGDNELQRYASMKNPNKKLEFGNELRTCLQELTALVSTVGALPEQKKAIDTLYQDAIWNPFMATVMDEDVKKRITTAYTKILVPYFLESITEKIDCENAGRWNEQLIQTDKRMQSLREEDTRKLERKLKREKDPEKILQLFFAQETEKED